MKNTAIAISLAIAIGIGFFVGRYDGESGPVLESVSAIVDPEHELADENGTTCYDLMVMDGVQSFRVKVNRPGTFTMEVHATTQPASDRLEVVWPPYTEAKPMAASTQPAEKEP